MNQPPMPQICYVALTENNNELKELSCVVTSGYKELTKYDKKYENNNPWNDQEAKRVYDLLNQRIIYAINIKSVINSLKKYFVSLNMDFPNTLYQQEIGYIVCHVAPNIYKANENHVDLVTLANTLGIQIPFYKSFSAEMTCQLSIESMKRFTLFQYCSQVHSNFLQTRNNQSINAFPYETKINDNNNEGNNMDNINNNTNKQQTNIDNNNKLNESITQYNDGNVIDDTPLNNNNTINGHETITSNIDPYNGDINADNNDINNDDMDYRDDWNNDDNIKDVNDDINDIDVNNNKNITNNDNNNNNNLNDMSNNDDNSNIINKHKDIIEPPKSNNINNNSNNINMPTNNSNNSSIPAPNNTRSSSSSSGAKKSWAKISQTNLNISPKKTRINVSVKGDIKKPKKQGGKHAFILKNQNEIRDHIEKAITKGNKTIYVSYEGHKSPLDPRAIKPVKWEGRDVFYAIPVPSRSGNTAKFFVNKVKEIRDRKWELRNVKKHFSSYGNMSKKFNNQ